MTSIALGPEDVRWDVLSSDHGLSPDAQVIRRQVREVYDDRTAGVNVTAPHRTALEGLRDTLLEATQPGWNGYGARPVTAAAAVRALQFISLFPTTLPPPDVSADANGRLHFEWHPGPGRAFVVSVGPSDMIYYAGLFGRSKVHGTEELGHELSPAVLANLARALGKAAG